MKYYVGTVFADSENGFVVDIPPGSQITAINREGLLRTRIDYLLPIHVVIEEDIESYAIDEAFRQAEEDCQPEGSE